MVLNICYFIILLEAPCLVAFTFPLIRNCDRKETFTGREVMQNNEMSTPMAYHCETLVASVLAAAEESEMPNGRYVMLHMKPGFLPLLYIACACVIKRTGPSRPSHLSQR